MIFPPALDPFAVSTVELLACYSPTIGLVGCSYQERERE